MAVTYVLAWLEAVALADVSTSAKAVALAVSIHADYGTGENMRAGTARLGHMAGLGERQTRTMMGELRAAGLIEWDGVPTAPGRARTYRLTIPDGGSTVPVSETERRQQAAGVDGSTAAMDRRNGGNTAPKRRQWVAAHQGQTMARPGDASRAAPGGAATTVAEPPSLPLAAHVFEPGCCNLPAANRRAHLEAS